MIVALLLFIIAAVVALAMLKRVTAATEATALILALAYLEARERAKENDQ